MSVDNPKQVRQHSCQTSVQNWRIANQLPTRLAIYRQLGL